MAEVLSCSTSLTRPFITWTSLSLAHREQLLIRRRSSCCQTPSAHADCSGGGGLTWHRSWAVRVEPDVKSSLKQCALMGFPVRRGRVTEWQLLLTATSPFSGEFSGELLLFMVTMQCSSFSSCLPWWSDQVTLQKLPHCFCVAFKCIKVWR